MTNNHENGIKFAKKLFNIKKNIMKKLLFLALGFAFFATSCSTKENQMNSTDVDSTSVSADSVSPSTMDNAAPVAVDSAATNVVRPDSAAVPPVTR